MVLFPMTSTFILVFISSRTFKLCSSMPRDFHNNKILSVQSVNKLSNNTILNKTLNSELPSNNGRPLLEKSDINTAVIKQNNYNALDNGLETNSFDSAKENVNPRSKDIGSEIGNFKNNFAGLITFNSNNLKGGSESNQSSDFLLSIKEQENNSSDNSLRQQNSRQFQFVFHPYIPYGKNLMPDEKISIHDVLHIKLAKFIKSMVEEAPWEAMFMKMTRMIVDHFVDRIMEKMFALKEDEDHKGRSSEVPLVKNSEVPTDAKVERRRRSSNNPAVKQNKDHPSENLLSKDRLSKGLEDSEDGSWLDLFLDYMFPEESKTDDESDTYKYRKKRNADQFISARDWNHQIKSEILEHINNLDVPFNLRKALKDFIKYRILKRLLKPFVDTADIDKTKLSMFPNYSTKNSNIMGLLKTMVLKPYMEKEKYPIQFLRHKRSLRNINEKEDTSSKKLGPLKDKFDPLNLKKENLKRLWQSDHELKSSNSKRDDCSLRRACNAGRLLSRLPSIEDITLQLKSHHHEPHWEALLWGIKKKRCSRIFCDRRRSPKGSRKYWNSSKRLNRKMKSTTHDPKHISSEMDMTTIIPI